jgi:hypothetical protein
LKKIILIHFLFVVNSYNLANGQNILPVGSEAKSLGGCGLLTNNAFCAANNQALMPWQKEKSIGVVFQNYYTVKDLNLINISATIPIENTGYGLNLFSFGNGAYKQQSIGAAVAYAFNTQLSLGMGADYHTIIIKQYGQNSILTIQGGLCAKVNSKLQLGFHVYNPLRAKFNNYKDERIASNYRLGLCYLASKLVSIYVEAEKNNLYKANLKTGINYSIKNNFNLRLGFASAQPQFCFGFGYRYKKMTIETASIIHQTIGLSSNISVIFKLGK